MIEEARSELDLGAKVLIVAHAAAAIVLIGSSTHNAVLSLLHLTGRSRRPRLQQLYATVMGWAYLSTFALGLLSYPTFRVEVRAAYLDEHVPLATSFFELKEHWLGIGLLMLACYWPLARTVDGRRRTADAMLFHVLGVALALVVWLALFTGLLVALIRPVGG